MTTRPDAPKLSSGGRFRCPGAKTDRHAARRKRRNPVSTVRTRSSCKETNCTTDRYRGHHVHGARHGSSLHCRVAARFNRGRIAHPLRRLCALPSARQVLGHALLVLCGRVRRCSAIGAMATAALNDPCAFCGRPPYQGVPLIAGPVVTICYECVTAATDHEVGAPVGNPPCSFCRREPGAALRGIDADRVGICIECLKLSADIMRENPHAAAMMVPRAIVKRPGWVARLRAWRSRT